VDGRDVGDDPDHPAGDPVASCVHGVGARCAGRAAQSPSACFRSSAREVSSHVKSLSDRPKWP